MQIVWIVGLQPQKRRAKLFDVDFEGHLVRSTVSEGSRPHHDERHVPGKNGQGRKESGNFLSEVAHVANVGQLSGARQCVDLHQRMYQGQHHLLLVRELGHGRRELLYGQAKHRCDVRRIIVFWFPVGVIHGCSRQCCDPGCVILHVRCVVVVVTHVQMPTFHGNWQNLVAVLRARDRRWQSLAMAEAHRINHVIAKPHLSRIRKMTVLHVGTALSADDYASVALRVHKSVEETLCRRFFVILSQVCLRVRGGARPLVAMEAPVIHSLATMETQNAATFEVEPCFRPVLGCWQRCEHVGSGHSVPRPPAHDTGLPLHMVQSLVHLPHVREADLIVQCREGRWKARCGMLHP